MHTKSGKILGNYLGWVVNTSPDPGGRMRVQVFIPHLTNTIYSSWNKNLTNRAFRNPNELGTETLTLLQQVLPWAECAMPIFGGGTSMKANGTTGIVNVNGGSTIPYTPDTVAGMAGAGVTVPSNAVGPSTETLAPMPDTSSDGTIWDDVQQPLSPDQSLGGPPTNSNYAVLLAGSNDTDPTTAAANVVNAIKLLQSQGKNVIVVPPSTQQGNVNSAVGQAIIDAASKWTTVETGLTYKGPGQDPWPYKHLSSGSAKYLLDAYGADAFYVGDSNTEEMQLIGVDPNNIFGFRGKQSGYIYEQLQGRFGQTGDEPLPPAASPVDDAAEDPNKTNGLDSKPTGTGGTDPQAANFQVDPRTRDLLLKAGIKSTPGNRLVSLDYQDAGSSIGIVIPNNYTQAELNEAIKSVNSFKSWLAEFGINRELATTEPYGGGKTIAPGVYLTTHVSAGGVSRFHTEFFSQTDTQIMNLVQNNTASPNSGATYAQILAGTLGTLPGTTFIPPHQQSDTGTPDGNGFLNERDFASQYILGPLAALNGQTINVPSGAVAGGTDANAGQTGNTPQQIPEDPTDIVQVNIAGNQGSVPDTTIAGNGSPNGFFSVPAYGAKVWVFFYDGDVQRPIYFAAVVEPSAGQTT